MTSKIPETLGEIGHVRAEGMAPPFGGRRVVRGAPFKSHARLQGSGEEIGKRVDGENCYNPEKAEEIASRSESDQGASAPDELIEEVFRRRQCS